MFRSNITFEVQISILRSKFQFCGQNLDEDPRCSKIFIFQRQALTSEESDPEVPLKGPQSNFDLLK